MQWFHRSDIWLSILLAISVFVTSIYVIETAYQTRQMYSALQELRAERDRLRGRHLRVEAEPDADIDPLRARPARHAYSP